MSEDLRVLAERALTARHLRDGLCRRLAQELARAVLSLLSEKETREVELRMLKASNTVLNERLAETAEQRAGEILGVVQRFQPGGSPPPGRPIDLVWWIMKTLNGRAEKAEAAAGKMRRVCEAAKKLDIVVVNAQVMFRGGCSTFALIELANALDALRVLEGREEKGQG